MQVLSRKALDLFAKDHLSNSDFWSIVSPTENRKSQLDNLNRIKERPCKHSCGLAVWGQSVHIPAEEGLSQP